MRTAAPPWARACPSCGYQPSSGTEAANQREDLTVAWLERNAAGEPVEVRRHCTGCQPRGPVAALVCAACGDGPLLTGNFAVQFDAGGIGAVEPTSRYGPGWPTMAGWLLPSGGHPRHRRPRRGRGWCARAVWTRRNGDPRGPGGEGLHGVSAAREGGRRCRPYRA